MYCDLCDSTEYEALFKTSVLVDKGAEKFSVVRCSKCGLVRTEPQPEDPARYYPEDEYYSFAPPRRPSAGVKRRLRGFYAEANQSWPRRRTARIASARLAPGLPPGPPGEILDVGCGSGEMLLALKSVGWSCHGIDISPTAVEAARRVGLDDVRSGSLTEAGYPARSFDVVRFWHSLEHVRSPRAYLTEARRLLRLGGRLVVGVPNFSSLLSRLTRERWYYLDVPRHLWHFNANTLGRLAMMCGFEVCRLRLVTTSTPILGTIENLVDAGGALRDNRLLWRATLPLAITADLFHLGENLELVATVSAQH